VAELNVPFWIVPAITHLRAVELHGTKNVRNMT
jgi:hypothetical protein